MFHTSNKVAVSSLKARLARSAIEHRTAAYRLEPGLKREALIMKAHEAEATIQIDDWISSSSLRAPM